MSRYFYLYDNEEEGYLTDDSEFVTNEIKEAKAFTEQTLPSWIIHCDWVEREYLPEDQQAKLNGHPALFVIRKGKMMPATLDQRVKRILDNVAAAKRQLEELQHKIDFLNSVGRYPAKGKLSPQRRKNSTKKYYFMTFRSDGNGAYKGPDGKRKVYIGSEDDVEAIAEAKRLNRNFLTWQKLDRARIELKDWILTLEYDLKDLERSCNHYLERSEHIPPMPNVEILTPDKLPGLEDKAA